MKKITSLLVCSLMLLPAMAYGDAATTVDATTTVENTYTAPEAGSALTLEGDMGLLVEGQWYPILNDFAALKDALGEPVDEYDAPSCVFQGEDKEFVYDGMSIYTNPLSEVDVWYEAYITEGEFTTVRGIGAGADKDSIIAAYGEGYYMESDTTLTYSVSGVEGDYESPCIMFELDENNVVISIDIYYPTNTL